MNIAMELATGELKAYRAMLDGVAFKTGSNKYEVFSHEGEYIDTFLVMDIESVVAKLRKKLGISPTVHPPLGLGEPEPYMYGFTYAY